MLTTETAKQQLQEYLASVPKSKRKIAEDMGVPEPTFTSWILRGTFPILQIFNFPYVIEALEYALTLALKIKGVEEFVSMIEIKRQFLNLEESHQFGDRNILYRHIAKVKSMLDRLSMQVDVDKQMGMAI